MSKNELIKPDDLHLVTLEEKELYEDTEKPFYPYFPCNLDRITRIGFVT